MVGTMVGFLAFLISPMERRNRNCKSLSTLKPLHPQSNYVLVGDC